MVDSRDIMAKKLTEGQYMKSSTPASLSAHRQKIKQVKCNICEKPFNTANPFRRFCGQCKSESELYKFSDWLTQSDKGPSQYDPSLTRAKSLIADEEDSAA